MAPDPVAPVTAFRPAMESLPSYSEARPRPDAGRARRSAVALAADLLAHDSSDAPADTVLALVREALEESHPESALKLLDPLWHTGVAGEDSWFLRGQALYQLRRFAEAGEVAGQGLSRVPASVALRYLVANSHLALGDAAAAEASLRAALALAPDQPVLLCRLAELLSQVGRREEAVHLLDRAAAAAPAHPVVMHQRATLAAATAEPFGRAPAAVMDAAIDCYTRAGIGLALLLPSAAPAAAEPVSLIRWREPVRLALLGLAVVLWLTGERTAGVVLGLTSLAGPILGRARGR